MSQFTRHEGKNAIEARITFQDAEPNRLIRFDSFDSLDLIETAMQDIENLKKQGASDKNLVKVKETQRKEVETNLKENPYWMSALQSAYRYGSDPENILNQNEAIDKLKSKDVKKAAKNYFNMENFAKFVLRPETETQER